MNGGTTLPARRPRQLWLAANSRLPVPWAATLVCNNFDAQDIRRDWNHPSRGRILARALAGSTEISAPRSNPSWKRRIAAITASPAPSGSTFSARIWITLGPLACVAARMAPKSRSWVKKMQPLLRAPFENGAVGCARITNRGPVSRIQPRPHEDLHPLG